MIYPQGGYCGGKKIVFPISYSSACLSAGLIAFDDEAVSGYIPGRYYNINKSQTTTGFSFGQNSTQWWVSFGY